MKKIIGASFKRGAITFIAGQTPQEFIEEQIVLLFDNGITAKGPTSISGWSCEEILKLMCILVEVEFTNYAPKYETLVTEFYAAIRAGHRTTAKAIHEKILKQLPRTSPFRKVLQNCLDTLLGK